jgi:tyrosine ammonia-lyase
MGITSKTQPHILVLDQHIEICDAYEIITGKVRIALSNQAINRCFASHERLQKVITENRHVYGLTTGFGPLANRLVDKAQGALLQQNLVNHLATGVGPILCWRASRAMVLARLLSILQGASGASEFAIASLVALMNSEFAPSVPSKGTVGASGDLTPLAHMVLCFQGRGAFIDKSGRVLDGMTGLQKLGVPPIDLARRDGLALVNGTSAMTGIAVLNAVQGERAVAWSLALTAMLAETQNGRVEAWHAAFGALRPHHGQVFAAKALRDHVGESGRVTHGFLAQRCLVDAEGVIEDHAGQDAYTLRCAPQVIGAVVDTFAWHHKVVSTELTAVTDNPIFPPNHAETAFGLHGGNFMGQHVGLASDAFANAATVLAGLAERQVARLTDEVLNRGLPAFLHTGAPGLNSGFMGAQVTATALLAEMRSTGAASVQSISTNGANQDVVSMGTIAARLAHTKLEALAQIQAILALALAQAVDIMCTRNADVPFSRNATQVRDFVRTISAPLNGDRPLGRDIEAVAKAIAENAPPE